VSESAGAGLLERHSAPGAALGDYDNDDLIEVLINCKVDASGRTQIDEVRSGGSYLSQNDLRLHFGQGAADRVDHIEIAWPSGVRQVLNDIAADRIISIEEPRN
jgi:hypothetical protein